MKALILAGGYATRLWPLTKEKAKPLLLVNGKPMVTHVLDKIPSEIEVFVATNEPFKKDFNAWKKNLHRPVKMIYEKTSNNANKLGAIGAIASFIKENNIKEDLLIIGGDNYFKFEIQDFLANYKGDTLIAAYNVGSLEKAKRFGVLSVQGNKVVEFAEKPQEPKSTLVNTFCCVFPKSIYPMLFDFVKIHTDNQGSFIEYLVNKTDVRAYITEEDWFDIGSFDGYMEAHRNASKERNHDTSSKFFGVDFWGEKNTIKGNVFIDEGTAIKNSTINNCIILGHCMIEDSTLKNCIIDEGSYISNCKLSETMIEKGTHMSNTVLRKDKKKHLDRDLSIDAGIAVKLKGFELYLKNKKVEFASRFLEDARPYLAKSKAESKIEELYRMYRDVHLDSDEAKLRNNHLRYDITVVVPGLVGDEYVKTVGHYHPIIEGSKVTYPEIYEVIEGHANYVLQNCKENHCNEVIVIDAKAGDKVVIPPNYGHVTINDGHKYLVMANITADNFSSDYKDYKRYHGAAVYRTKDGWVPNSKYKVASYKKVRPNLSWYKYDENLPLYKSLIKNTYNYDFLVSPDKYDFSKVFEAVSEIKFS